MLRPKHHWKLEPVSAVSDLEVVLSVVLAEKSFSLEELMEIRAGRLLELGGRHDSPLELHLNSSCLGRGRAIDLGERLGFLLEEVDRRVAPEGSEGVL